MIRILTADRQTMFREGLARVLSDRSEFHLVAEAWDGPSVDAALLSHDVDVAIVDIGLLGREPQTSLAGLRAMRRGLRVLVLSSRADDPLALQALKGGAHGFITRENECAELFAALQRIASGGRYVCPAVAERLTFDLTGGPRLDEPEHARLSQREHAVFQLLIAGRRGSEIAQALSLSEKTVSTHKAHVLRKLNLGNVSELMRYAIRHQLVAL